MIKRLCVFALLGVRALFGWGCEGHQTVALLAERNLTPHALAEVKGLLAGNPVDPNLVRYCAQGQDDLMTDASTWPDDARRIESTGKWHYMDIPRQQTEGDAMKWCEPVGPPNPAEHNERPGCVLTAIEFNRKIVADETAAPADRAKALRYLIHFIGDVHMPLHTTANNDNGGNCTDMVLLDGAARSNLHSIWDSGILDHRLRELHWKPPAYADALNTRFAAQKTNWSTTPAKIGEWIWEAHTEAAAVTYGAIRPEIPIEPEHARTDCPAETLKVYKLNIHLGTDYTAKAQPVIDRQIARAGFRLAATLNEIWP